MNTSLPSLHTKEYYKIAPKPLWVKDIGPLLSVSEEIEGQEATEHLLVEDQVFIGSNLIEHFVKTIRHIVNESALEKASHFKIGFQPTYEQIILHELSIIRNQNTIDLLAKAHIRVIDDEYELHRDILSDTKILYILLEDLRVGDKLVLNYTRIGFNPIFEGAYSRFFFLNYSVPIKRLYRRFVWDKDKNIAYKLINTSIQPEINKGEITIDEKNVLPVTTEDCMPHWYSPYSYIQLSKSHSWKEVIHWGCQHFSVPQYIGTELEKIAQDIKNNYEDLSEQVIAALRFVQNHIRYTALSMGEASHKPYAPELVLNRRFGDCKDKSLLLVSLLHLLSVKAAVALVHTSDCHTVRGYLPAPILFNHAIVAIFWESRIYWVDPTYTNQEGDLEHCAQSLYGAALILDPGFPDLVSCQPEVSSQATREVRETYAVCAENKDLIELTVETVSRGHSADGLRARLIEESLEEMRKAYLNFLLKDFQEIESIAPLEIKDDKKLNVLTIIEKYLIKNPWTKVDYGTYIEKSFFVPAYEIRPYTTKPYTLQRDHLLGINFPVFVRQQTRICLQGDASLSPKNMAIENNHVHFSQEVTIPSTKEIVWTKSFQTLQGAVLPSDIPSYLKDLDRIYETCYLRVSETEEKSGVDLESIFCEHQAVYKIPAEIKKPVLFSSQVNFRGETFQGRQDWLKNTPIEEITEGFLAYCQRFYPNITMHKPLQVEQHKDGLEVTEVYLIEKFWEWNADSNVWDSKNINNFELIWLINHLFIEKDKEKNINLLPYVDYRFSIVVYLPKDDWHFEKENLQCQNSFFKFHHASEFDKDAMQWKITQHFRLLKDQITRSEVDEFNQCLEALWPKTAWVLSRRKEET